MTPIGEQILSKPPIQTLKAIWWAALELSLEVKMGWIDVMFLLLLSSDKMRFFAANFIVNELDKGISKDDVKFESSYVHGHVRG